MATFAYPGPHCQEAGIRCDVLLSVRKLKKLTRGILTKGMVCELNDFRKESDIPWHTFHQWIIQLTGEDVNLSSLKVSISRLNKKRTELVRNKEHTKLNELMHKQHFSSSKKVDDKACTGESATTCVKRSEAFEAGVLVTVNNELAEELHTTKQQLDQQQAVTDELTDKLRQLSVRNVNKRIRRRDKKIEEAESQVSQLQEEAKVKTDKLVQLEDKLTETRKGAERNRVNFFNANKRIQELQTKMKEVKSTVVKITGDFNAQSTRFNDKVSQLSSALEAAHDDCDQLHHRVADLEEGVLETMTHKRRYFDNVRQCCAELLSLNVGVANVEPVIRSVLKHVAGFEVQNLPAPTTLIRILTEMKVLSCQQLSEDLSQCKDVTLHSDGTSKWGQHYYSFQVSTSGSTYTLGLAEMLTGSTVKVLDTFKQVLADIELVGGENAASVILAKIKNTMSDRHIVEKNFNTLLEEYRSSILPDVVQSWNALSCEEQQSMSTLNNFFCGMHVLVGMADAASATLCQWEATHFKEHPIHSCVLIRKSEPGIVRLIRTACKAFSKHGSEQSGVYLPFTSFLTSNGIKRNPLASFRGNRFNILFYDAGAVFYISDLIMRFFREVWQTPNQLLRAVFSDIQVPEHLAGCRALGLVNKVVTGPLWRILETADISILEMNEYFQILITHLDLWSLDSSEVLSGHAVIFPDFPPSEDEIWNSLIAPSEYDAIAQELLQVLFGSFSVLLSRLVRDHLPGGDLDEPSLQLQEETKSVPKTNTVSERDFAKLDRLLREKPNATTLSLEAMILFTNNKTASWLRAKPNEEVRELMQKARSMAPEFKRLYDKRRQQIREERVELLKAKQHALLAAQERNVRQKEQLTQDIIRYGLWQSPAQVADSLSQLKSKAEKLKALKAQLNFRKKVLQQVPTSKELYFTTRNGKQLPIEEIKSNLTLLLQQSCEVPVSSLASVNQESLVGKKIRHRWCDPDGTEQWYSGRILSVVPGTTEWFNVKYDGEEEVLSLNLYTDIENGDLDIV